MAGNSYPKFLKSVTVLAVDPKQRSAKYCITCSNLATKEACFDVGDGVSVIEKYCDKCAGKLGKTVKKD